MAVGRPSAWPTIWARWDVAYRVKSGIFKATVAQKPTMPVSEGMKKRRNSPVLWNLLGVSSTGPIPPALPVTQNRSSSPTTSMNGSPMPSRNLMVSIRRQMTNIFSTQERKKQTHKHDEWGADDLEKLDGFDPAPNDKHIHRPEEKKANPRARWQARGARPDDSQHRVNGLTADPRLDTEPAASHESSQNRRYVRPAHTERSANENRERNAVLGTRVRIQNHWNKHDQVAEQNCADGLIPIHPAGNEAGRKHVGRDADAHGDP